MKDKSSVMGTIRNQSIEPTQRTLNVSIGDKTKSKYQTNAKNFICEYLVKKNFICEYKTLKH